MPPHVIFAVAGALCGTLGSIFTAFSVNRVLEEMRRAHDFLSVTAEALATDQRDVPVFTGTDRRIINAQSCDKKKLCAGIVLLALGFILQSVSVIVR